MSAHTVASPRLIRGDRYRTLPAAEVLEHRRIPGTVLLDQTAPSGARYLVVGDAETPTRVFPFVVVPSRPILSAALFQEATTLAMGVLGED